MEIAGKLTQPELTELPSGLCRRLIRSVQQYSYFWCIPAPNRIAAYPQSSYGGWIETGQHLGR